MVLHKATLIYALTMDPISSSVTECQTDFLNKAEHIISNIYIICRALTLSLHITNPRLRRGFWNWLFLHEALLAEHETDNQFGQINITPVQLIKWHGFTSAECTARPDALGEVLQASQTEAARNLQGGLWKFALLLLIAALLTSWHMGLHLSKQQTAARDAVDNAVNI